MNVPVFQGPVQLAKTLSLQVPVCLKESYNAVVGGLLPLISLMRGCGSSENSLQLLFVASTMSEDSGTSLVTCVPREFFASPRFEGWQGKLPRNNISSYLLSFALKTRNPLFHQPFPAIHQTAAPQTPHPSLHCRPMPAWSAKTSSCCFRILEARQLAPPITIPASLVDAGIHPNAFSRHPLPFLHYFKLATRGRSRADVNHPRRALCVDS